jgi:starch synthase
VRSASPQSSKPLKILIVAAENDALPGAKAGGVGDVVRDVPLELARRGCVVTVVIPAYGSLVSLSGSRPLDDLYVPFGGSTRKVGIYEVHGRTSVTGIRHLVLDDPLFAPHRPGEIYCHDHGAPFATDASKFALFSAAVAAGANEGAFGSPDVVHLNDWHTGLYLALRESDPRLSYLRAIRTVFTIHNLALQGQRPLEGDPSSWQAWFPQLDPVDELRDPHEPELANPMAAGIRLSDAVHVVSPSYAEEIQRPSSVAIGGFYGGEGLEGELRTAHEAGRVFGILNGCDYHVGAADELAWPDLVATMRAELGRWLRGGPGLATAHYLADERLRSLPDARPDKLLTSVSRVAEQKIRLLREPGPEGRPAIHHLLDALGEDGIYIFAGTGDPEYVRFLTAVSARRSNFIFLNGYTPGLADALYSAGDLYVMPSSYEPCGISQMLAMRSGQPCLVHHVGGLRDTVTDGVTGFAFTGESAPAQARGLVDRLQAALSLREQEPSRWAQIRRQAQEARFPWTESVEAYLTNLYAA